VAQSAFEIISSVPFYFTSIGLNCATGEHPGAFSTVLCRQNGSLVSNDQVADGAGPAAQVWKSHNFQAGPQRVDVVVHDPRVVNFPRRDLDLSG
jgi:hypothetical protein